MAVPDVLADQQTDVLTLLKQPKCILFAINGYWHWKIDVDPCCPTICESDYVERRIYIDTLIPLTRPNDTRKEGMRRTHLWGLGSRVRPGSFRSFPRLN
jgi:hypothetical protein